MLIKITQNYSIEKADEMSFQELGNLVSAKPAREADLEELIRKNVELIFEDETDALVIGQQVLDDFNKRSDLVAIDGTGALVLIEIKLDITAINSRSEALETQAIRYAANYALLRGIDDIVEKLFAPYIEKHIGEFQQPGQSLTSAQIARIRLEGFLDGKNAIETLNARQRIFLVACDFPLEVLSACAWLAANSVPIHCIEARPLKVNSECFMAFHQVIPPPTLASYYVSVKVPKVKGQKAPVATMKTPSGSEAVKGIKLAKLVDLGIINPEDEVYLRGVPGKVAIVVDANDVKYDGKTMSYQDWGKRVKGWQAINIYDWAVLKRTEEPFQVLRQKALDLLQTGAPQDLPEPSSPVDTSEGT